MDNEKRNASGYLDLTAYKAVKEAYRKELTARRGRVMKKLFAAAEAEGRRHRKVGLHTVLDGGIPLILRQKCSE